MASTCKAAPAALLAALVAAVLACTLWSLSVPSAYADEEGIDPDVPATEETDLQQADEGTTPQPAKLSTTELASLDGVTDKYSQVYDTEEWTEQSYTYKAGKVTITESTDDEGRYISLTAEKDAEVDMVIVQLGNDYLESALPKGTLEKGTTYLIPVPKDAKVMHVALYQAKDDESSDGDDAAAENDPDAADPTGDDTDALIDEQADGDGTDGNGTDGDGQDGNVDGEGQDGNGTDDEGQDDNVDGEGQDGTDDQGDGTDDGTDEGADQGTEDESGTGSDEGTEDETGTGSDEGTEDETGTGSDEGDGSDDATLDSQSEDSGKPIVVATANQTTTSESSSTSTSAKVYSMSIGKVDAKSNALLAGAEFQIKSSSGEVVATWTSSTSGPQQVSGLRTDTTYVLTETKAPQGYNRERDINIKYDATSNKVLIDQGGAAVALDNNSEGSAVLNVKDMQGGSSVQTSASTSPKTGDNQMLPIIVGALVVIVAVAAAVAVKARKNSSK